MHFSSFRMQTLYILYKNKTKTNYTKDRKFFITKCVIFFKYYFRQWNLFKYFNVYMYIYVQYIVNIKNKLGNVTFKMFLRFLHKSRLYRYRSSSPIRTICILPVLCYEESTWTRTMADGRILLGHLDSLKIEYSLSLFSFSSERKREGKRERERIGNAWIRTTMEMPRHSRGHERRNLTAS